MFATAQPHRHVVSEIENRRIGADEVSPALPSRGEALVAPADETTAS